MDQKPFLSFGFCMMVLSLFLLPYCRPAAGSEALTLIRQFDSLLNKKEFFRLERQLALHHEELPAARRLYFEAALDNAFNRNSSCVARIDSVLGSAPAGFQDSLKVNLLQLSGDSYFKMGFYAQAARTDSLLIHDFNKTMDSAALASVKDDWLIRNALRNQAPQTTEVGAGAVLTWSRDSIGLMEFPFRSHAQTVNAIFDTRANISSITRSYAEKLHLHLLDVNYTGGSGVTGLQFKMGLGVADSLYIGGVLVLHAVFQVMPDSILYIAPLHFQLNVIMGLPVIAQLQELQIYNDGRLVIPSVPTPGDLHNMALDGLDPVVLLRSDGDTLLYHFDSGASSTVLYATYFNRYHAAILRSGHSKRTKFGGAGGVKVNETFMLPSFRLELGPRAITIDSVSVLTEKISDAERFYGNVGQDFMRQFKEMTLNFRDMYVKGI
ncbi:MAG TPA: retropepsin-like aspartic protease [Puia sp.]|nr:retropepsin-like aspartic protease [Puia sp.]